MNPVAASAGGCHGVARVTGSPRVVAHMRALSYVFLGVAPILLTGDFLYICFHESSSLRAVDFHHEFWPAAHRILDGLSPYDRGWQDIRIGLAFPYPALTGLAFVPFALISRDAADVLFTGITIAALLLTLRRLRVRDLRVYGLALMWPPVCTAWQSANLTLLLALGVAYLWCEQDHPVRAGLIAAVTISLKPFLWPLALWLLVSRRYLALGWALAWGAMLNVVAWAVVGFSQVPAYETELHAVTAAMYHRGYTIVDFVLHVGGNGAVGYASAGTVAVIAAVACILAGRRGDDEHALTLSLALSLLTTPILWSQYFALLIVPLALARPRLAPVWFLPLVLWACPTSSAATWQIALALLVGAALVAFSLRSPKLTGASRELVLGTRPLTEPVGARAA